MKVKILKDFNYSLDGIKPTSFKAGDTTEKFSPEIIKNLMAAKLVGVKGSKLTSPAKTDTEKIEAMAEKLETRGAELIKAGAVLAGGEYCWLKDKVRKEDLLEASDEDWGEFVAWVVKSIEAAKNTGNVDTSFGGNDNLGNESEKSDEPKKPLTKAEKKAAQKEANKNKNK